MTVRDIIAKAFLIIETCLSVPVFLVSWLVSAIVLAVVTGWRFAKIEADKDKAAILHRVLGGKARK